MVTAIVLAGGKGERLRPLTDDTPKPLLEIDGKPILLYAIGNFLRHGIKDIILSVGYEADKIKEYFGDGSKFGVSIMYVVEDEPLGTGGALKKAAKEISETFIAINGDNLADFDWTALITQHKRSHVAATLALFPVEDVTQYGIAHVVDGKIIEFVEKPTRDKAPSNLNNAGGYVLEPRIFDGISDEKFSIERDCFEKRAPDGEICAFEHTGYWYPTDTIEKFRVAEEAMKRA